MNKKKVSYLYIRVKVWVRIRNVSWGSKKVVCMKMCGYKINKIF